MLEEFFRKIENNQKDLRRSETKLEKKARKHSVGLMRGAGGVIAETIREAVQGKRLKLIKGKQLSKALDGHGDER